jgi:hypothetical protein
MGQADLLPLRRKACCGFFLPKNRTATVRFEPAILGTRGQRAKPRTTEAAAIFLMTQVFLKKIKTIISGDVTVPSFSLNTNLLQSMEGCFSNSMDIAASKWNIQLRAM